MDKLLVIDDNINFLDDLELLLKDKYDLVKAQTGNEGLNLLRAERVSTVLLDLHLPDIYGLEILKTIRDEIDPHLPVIIITEFDSTENVVEAMKAGAYDFLTKDFNLELLSAKIDKALKHRKLELEVDALQRNISDQQNTFIFSCDEMKKLNYEITKLARLNFDVLLTGETGTGKDLVSSLIHNRSSRKDKPFISVSLKSLSENVIESELFGHEKGAFTGADKMKIGLFEAANGGTVYIPEISCLSESIQLKLLHFMQYKSISRVGQDRRKGEIKLDVRVLMATNEELEKLVESGKIREDFYYRISGLKLNIPPLRSRKEDIPKLVEYYLTKYSNLFGQNFIIEDGLMDELMQYEWRGNVRELENSIKGAMIYSNGNIIRKEHFPNLFHLYLKNDDTNSSENEMIVPYEVALENFKKRYLTKVWKEANGVSSKASMMTGLTQQGLRKLLKKYPIIN